MFLSLCVHCFSSPFFMPYENTPPKWILSQAHFSIGDRQLCVRAYTMHAVLVFWSVWHEYVCVCVWAHIIFGNFIHTHTLAVYVSIATNRRPIKAIYLWEVSFTFCTHHTTPHQKNRPERREMICSSTKQIIYWIRFNEKNTHTHTRVRVRQNEREEKEREKKGMVEVAIRCWSADDGSMSMTVRYRNDWWPFSERSRAQSNQISNVFKRTTKWKNEKKNERQRNGESKWASERNFQQQKMKHVRSYIFVCWCALLLQLRV